MAPARTGAADAGADAEETEIAGLAGQQLVPGGEMLDSQRRVVARRAETAHDG
jgi:hypothetical protein